jgi:hypothetical protein
MGAAPNLDMDIDDRTLTNGQAKTQKLETESLTL